MDSESSGQVKRQADNHHVKRPAKKRRSQDEDYLFLKSDWYRPFQVLKSDWDPGAIYEVKHHEEDGSIKFPVLKSGCDMDYTDESEMKCDSEGLNAAKGSNEMAGGLISWGQFRKVRCSGPFVVGSVKNS